MATTGRWKANNDGSAYWDANDTGPDQVQPTPEQKAKQQGQASVQQAGQPDQGQASSPWPSPATSGSGNTSQSPYKVQPWTETGQYDYHTLPVKDWSKEVDPSHLYTMPDGSKVPYIPFNNPYDMPTGGWATTGQGMDESAAGSGANQPLEQALANSSAYAFPKTDETSGSVQAQPGSEFAKDSTDLGQAATQASTLAQPTVAATTPKYQFMEGVNMDKLNDPTHQTPKYIASRILASGGTLADAAKAIGATVLDADKMRLPTGETIDTRRDMEGANALQWLVTDDPNAQPEVQAAGPGGYGGSLMNQLMARLGGTTIGTGAGGSGEGLNPSGTDRNNMLWNILAGRAGMNEMPSANDPVIAGQVNAYRAEQERAARNNLAQAAEAQGPNANLNSERRMANESAARATGGLQSQLMQNELTARRGMIQNAISQMGGMLSDTQKLELQRELGLIDAMLNQQRINSANDQFMAELGLRAEDQSNRWDWLRSGGTL